MIRAGYKQTEIGVIPKDWVISILDQLASKVGSGITPRGGSNAYKLFGRPFVRSQNVGWGILKLGDIAFIDDKTHETFQNTEIRFKDVFLNISGASIGRSAVANRELVGGNVNQHVCILRTKREKLHPIFLNKILLSTIGQDQIDSFQSGGNREGLNIGQIKTFKIPLPPLPEQIAIATVLSDTDKLLQAIEKKIAKKRLIRQGAMQELLRPKEGWVVKKLGDIAEIVGGGTPSTFTNDYWNGDIDWFTPTEVGKIKYLSGSKRKITNQGLKNCSARILPLGTILLTSRAGIGDLGILIKEACTNQGFQSLIVNDLNSLEFVYYLLVTLKPLLLQNASGSTFLEISPNKVKAIEITIPTKQEQIKIATTLSDMDSEIENLEKQLAKYKQVKQGLMQNLLTGKIRLV